MASHGQPLGAKKRLDSWKEIAAFFGRDERTVKRWEKERGLPVYRVPGSARGGVFAYAEELAEWLKAPKENWDPADSVSGEAASAGHGFNSSTQAQSSALAGPASENVVSIKPAAKSGKPVPPTAGTVRSGMSAGRILLWLTPLVLVAGTLLIFSFGHREIRFRNALAAPHRPSADAQDLYLKGRYYFEKRTPDDLNRAVDYFTQAIVRDPGYAAPYVGLADSYNLLREYSVMPPEEAFPRALAAATKAVELDPNNAEGHNSLAFASFWGRFDAATADREFKRAIELDPRLPRAHHWYATFLIEVHRNQEALEEIERARQLDPSSTPILADKGLILAAAGKMDDAKALLMQMVTSQPDFPPSHRYLAEVIYLPEENYSGYFSEMATVARLKQDANAEKRVEAEQEAYNRGGVRGWHEERLATALDSFNRGNGSACDVAAAYAQLGQKENAMKYLEIAHQHHDLSLATVTTARAFEALRQDAAFRALEAKLGLPPAP